ncbi:hypothetical protein [Pendulispora albinea]|uniref:STAS domain-containing protein n=1 Tax=Pendulispora albinea TaxID=2741071 RepID=A0ABZ2M6P5_9BACT
MSTECFEFDRLTIRVTRDRHASATIAWEGVSDARNPNAFLEPLLQKILAGLRATKVTVDLRLLEYINSATVSPILNLIKRCDTDHVATTVLYDTGVDWQRVNYQCMRTIARTLSHVEVKMHGE